ncbi:MAG: VanW family protein [Abditibacteriota bacterium]|nr:VanW family protein [Abditibacteriota bacterium]
MRLFGRNFSDLNPLFWNIATRKGILARNIKDFFGKERFASERRTETLPAAVSSYRSALIKTGPGIDPETQTNKAVNIRLASEKICGMVIKPGETFSFWRAVGNVSKKQGYKEGRVIRRGTLVRGTGGGLCNLANTINNLVLRSPLEITEFHKHSDALACDIGHRVPMANGTSVSFNYVDYRFKNNTGCCVQLLVRCEGGDLVAELRSEKEFPFSYDISEEGHRFVKEDGRYYRVSKIYKDTKNRATGETVERELIWDNRSLVMFDPALIPEEELKER